MCITRKARFYSTYLIPKSEWWSEHFRQVHSRTVIDDKLIEEHWDQGLYPTLENRCNAVIKGIKYLKQQEPEKASTLNQ